VGAGRARTGRVRGFQRDWAALSFPMLRSKGFLLAVEKKMNSPAGETKAKNRRAIKQWIATLRSQ